MKENCGVCRMNINEFSHFIDRKILDRGYDYYIEGNITDLYQNDYDEYVIRVAGSSEYRVRVQIADNGDIIKSACDCPYDFGPICKHEVAAYFLVADKWDDKNKMENIPIRKEETIHTVLSSLSKEELIEIIVDITDDDPTFERNILFKYTSEDGGQALESSRQLIHAIVKKHQGREGFIRYYDAMYFANELEEVADKARDMDDAIVGLDIAFLLLEEAIDALSYADDSGGGIGFLVKQILGVIQEIVSDEPKDVSVELFWKLLEQVDNEVLEDWIDYKIDLLAICVDLAEEEIISSLTDKIKSMIAEKPSGLYSKHTNEQLLQLLYKLISKHGTNKEAEQFIHDHVQYSFFREELLKKYLREKKFEKVIEVAKAGEEQDVDYRGLESRWQAYRYEGLKHLSLKDEQQKLAWDMFLKGDFDYYYDLKELTTDSEAEFYKNVKAKLQRENSWSYRGLLLELIREENDVEALLEYVGNYPMYIEEYAEELVNHYKEEVIEIYKRFIESEAETSSTRKAYREVCYKLISFKKIAGEEEQGALIMNLMEKYKRRPAFIDELNKVL